MRAIVCEQLGEPEVMRLVDVPRPEPGALQMLVKNEAVGVNFVDTMRRSGRHPASPQPPFTPGIELCGRVVEVGSGVARFRVGDRILGRLPGGGAYAEYSVVEERFAVRCPEELPATKAAGIFVNGQTAWHALHTMGQLRAGETVLITAAAGGVGAWAVPLAVRAGATVIAAAGSLEKCQVAQGLGAKLAVNYRTERWFEQVLAATAGRGVELIVESVGGEVARGCQQAWAVGGRMVIYGEASGTPAQISGDTLLFGHRSVHGLAVGMVIENEDRMRRAMEELFAALADGWPPVIATEYPLGQASRAHRALESRASQGKLVLIP